MTAPVDGQARFDVLGVPIHGLHPAHTLAVIADWVGGAGRGYVCVANVHAVMEARRDPALLDVYRRGFTVPDGMPLVWMGRLRGERSVRRVYGPDLVLGVCEAAARHGWSVYFYGGGPGVAQRVGDVLAARYPGLKVAGTSAPPFRDLDAVEQADELAAIEAARPDVIFVGLGCPKQERWMASHRGRLAASVLIGVGAAFDFHAGTVRQAPRWMMAAGLEWLFRFSREPRRLWYRYLVYNPLFLFHVALQVLGLKRYP
jgi:N-acetylglucosaminyldiphosphoundecaprenol N-acetyl-beta-D-mannosaminyltransferase